MYQIYPRSFRDSTGNGIGDLQGIISRLDYLQDLGVGGIWLSPIYPSPMHDFGYDVSDYCAVSPEFGTMDDMKTLIRAGERRGIRIIMDLVLNHTSHRHPWFQESASSRDSAKRDWYLWHDGQPRRSSLLPGARPDVPNNWLSMMGGRAWQWEPNTEQYYLHSFLKEQPDVNWRNPGLQAAMWDVMRFWLDLGIGGFRLDVVNWLIKDEHWRSNPHGMFGLRPYDRQAHIYDRNRPETLEIVRQIRSVVDEYPDRMTVGEVYTQPPGNPELAAAYYDDGRGLHLAFNLAFMYSSWKAEAFSHAVERWEDLLGPELWPNYTLSNHDQVRAYSRYSRGGDGQARARVAAALLLTLRGTPFIYYGEEIGMRNGRIPRRQIRDPVGKRYWPFHAGRDGARTPMQWDASTQAGFSTGTPWLPVNWNYRTVNVESQQPEPLSLLNWYRDLIELRKREPALHAGTYQRICVEDGVFCYFRDWQRDRVLVALNFSGAPRRVSLPDDGRWQVLQGLSLGEGEALEPGSVLLGADDVLIAKRA
jgi:alpha-glucosidase